MTWHPMDADFPRSPQYTQNQLDALHAGPRWLQGVWGMAEGVGFERII